MKNPTKAGLRNLAIAVFGSFLLACAFVQLTSLIPETGRWYSSSLHYRLQTEALLQGRLAVASTPVWAWHDWSLGNGMQQVWGLGVPFLRLPFEALAKSLFRPAFPDRFVLFFMVWLTGISLWRGLADKDPANLNPSASIWTQTLDWLNSATGVGTVLFFPALVTLLKTSFMVYEEAIAFNALWALMCLGILLSFTKKPRAWVLCSIALLSSFNALIRPTGAFAAIATFLVALWAASRSGISRLRITAAILLFLVFPLLLLSTNLARFGGLLEFGYSLNAPNMPMSEYVLRFDNPFHREPLISASRELIRELFGSPPFNGFNFFERDLRSGSPTLRFREHYFTTFGAPALVFLIVGWGLLGTRVFRKQFRWLTWADKEVRIWTLLAWSVIAFCECFMFYLRAPVIASRYMVDFLPAIAACPLALLLLLRSRISRFANTRLAVAASIGVSVIAVASLAYGISASRISPSHAWQPAWTLDEVKAELSWFKPQAAAIPDAYECHHATTLGMTMNLDGWNADSDCGVHVLSVLIFDSPKCVQIDFENPTRQETPDYSTDEIRVRIHLTLAKRVSAVRNGETGTFIFCDPHANQSLAAGPVPRLVTIGWVNVEHFGKIQLPPIRLLRVRSVAPPV
jgi:hypothetical protein